MQFEADKLMFLLYYSYTYIPLMLYPPGGSRDISDIKPRPHILQKYSQYK
jgi:hypothetical protein